MLLLKRIHFWFGLAGILLFISTGAYMALHFMGLREFADGPRMLLRSGHIYILLSSLLNMVLGVYWQPGTAQPVKWLQLIISAILLVTPLILVTGFFTEYEMPNLQRPFTSISLYFLFITAILLVILQFKSAKKH